MYIYVLICQSLIPGLYILKIKVETNPMLLKFILLFVLKIKKDNKSYYDISFLFVNILQQSINLSTILFPFFFIKFVKLSINPKVLAFFIR